MSEIEVIVTQAQNLIERAQQVRYQVFTLEQLIPNEIDLDGKDSIGWHALGYLSDELAGVARLVQVDAEMAIISRVAVLDTFRNKGVAALLISALEKKAKVLNIHLIELFPHEFLRKYYESIGYHFIEKAGYAARYPLLRMGKKLL